MVGALVLAGLALKLLFEEPLLAHWLGLGLTLPPLPLAGAPGFAMASYAHFTGTVAGLACAVALDLALGLMRRKQRGPALGVLICATPV